MIVEGLVLGHILAPVISALVVTVLYHYLGRKYLGAEENEYWNAFRKMVLSAGDSTIRKKTNFSLTNAAHNSHKIGKVRSSSDELAVALEKAGYLQCVLSGLKYRPEDINPNTSSVAEYEDGAMVFRESRSDLVPDALAIKQTHVFWFDNEDGTIDVYAHHEYSSLNPLVSWWHYIGKDQDPEEGERIVQSDLEREGISFE